MKADPNEDCSETETCRVC